jgi:hypothetical protein
VQLTQPQPRNFDRQRHDARWTSTSAVSLRDLLLTCARRRRQVCGCASGGMGWRSGARRAVSWHSRVRASAPPRLPSSVGQAAVFSVGGQRPSSTR